MDERREQPHARLNLQQILDDRRELKRYEIASNGVSFLETHGTFLRDLNQDFYYYDSQYRDVLLLDSQEYKDRLSILTGINPASLEFRYLNELAGLTARQTAVLENIHRFSFFDENTNTLCIQLDCRTILRLDAKEHSTFANGEGGIYFARDEHFDPFQLVDVDPEGAFALARTMLVEAISFDDSNLGMLTSEEQKYLYGHFILLLFFLAERRTKPPLVLIGKPGSGKSTGLRVLGTALFGEKFELMSVADTEKDVVATITRRPFVVIDNVDSPSPFLDDLLARTSTGIIFSRRKLYTDNDEVVIRPRAHIAITSMSPYFRREDVADRILLFYLIRDESRGFVDEHKIITDVLHNRNKIMTGIVHALKVALKRIESTISLNLKTTFRMADAATLLLRMASEPDYMAGILNKMQENQTQFLAEGHPLTDLICLWLETNPLNQENYFQTTQLFQELKSFASWKHYDFPYKSSRSLGMALTNQRRAMELRLEVHERKLPSNLREFNFQLRTQSD